MKSDGVRHTKAWTVGIVVSGVMRVGDPQGPNHNKGGYTHTYIYTHTHLSVYQERKERDSL